MEGPGDPLFLDAESICQLHADQMRIFGQNGQLLDRGLLESAVTAPQNLWVYDNDADIFDLAASYCAHLAWNHPFQDGNKRVALSAALHFLAVNGLDAAARRDQPEEVRVSDEFLAGAVLALIERSTPESSFAETLFLTVGMVHLMETVRERLESLRETLRGVKFGSKEEADAYVTDEIMCAIVRSLIERCQSLFINPERYRRVEASIRNDVVSEVAPKYQIEFGMTTTDDGEASVTE
jgi:death on curing protein